MYRLYRKSELGFSLAWIAAYVVGSGVAGSVSVAFLLAWHLILCVVAIAFVKRHGLLTKYGLCAPRTPPSHVWFYLPLAALPAVNIACGLTVTAPWYESALSVGSMLCVGLLEELVFRGFLFCAMARDNRTAAIVVSSLTFGMGHIVNLLGGAPLLSTLCQIVYAAAGGYLFVILFLKTGSLWPAILTHSAVNALGVFVPDTLNQTTVIVTSAVLCAVSLGYAAILNKTCRSEYRL